MLPKIINPSDFRKHLASFMALASKQLIVIKDGQSNKVLMDETHYNQLSALANQFIQEDPEGKYRPKFEKEILERSKTPEVDESIASLSDLIC